MIASIDRVTDRLAGCQLLVDSVLINLEGAMNFWYSKITKPLQLSDLLSHIV